MTNYTELQDEGEIWFGEDSEETIVDFLTDRFDTSSFTRILDGSRSPS